MSSCLFWTDRKSSMAGTLVAGCICLSIFYSKIYPKTLTQAWTLNWASNGPFQTTSTSLIHNLVLTTLPQLALSITNVLYNSIWSTFALCSEYQRYSIRRRGLRVTKPQGSQRPTNRFSMPYRHLIPQTIVWTTLHFLVSTSVSASTMNVLDYPSRPTDQFRASYYGCPERRFWRWCCMGRY